MTSDIPWNALGLAYFVVIWVGYGLYAKSRAKGSAKATLSRAMRRHRDLWAERMLYRDNRIGDAALLANQERVVGFFASTTLLLLAAVLTALSRASELAEITQSIPFISNSVAELEFKFLVLALILIYAFFKVTWSLRQYGFVSVMVGSAPMPEEDLSPEDRQRFALQLGRLMDLAGHDNNSCLRAYYFGLAVMCWVGGNVAFVVATSLIALVLAEREFASGAVSCIRESEVDFVPLVSQGVTSTEKN
ncbi:DUF599 domain-containing protein [Luminiphilus sp.]|jgi:uncharacterized membrane protein|nr:DUF599 domain-containing protein [Luminiphilus sp.]